MSAFGLVLTAGYILWMVQRSLFGPQTERFSKVKDATPLEMVPVAALIIAIVVVGIYPAFISDVFKSGVEPIVESFQVVAQAGLR